MCILPCSWCSQHLSPSILSVGYPYPHVRVLLVFGWKEWCGGSRRFVQKCIKKYSSSIWREIQRRCPNGIHAPRACGVGYNNSWRYAHSSFRRHLSPSSFSVGYTSNASTLRPCPHVGGESVVGSRGGEGVHPVITHAKLISILPLAGGKCGVGAVRNFFSLNRI